MSNYFIENKETGKIELYFDKADYMAMPDDDKQKVKSNFLFSRKTGAWISRRKFPNLYYPRQVAIELGLVDEGSEGERLSFAEQKEREQEKADRRADYYDYKAGQAQQRGESLQKPINDMHGDIAFFTQPNISTASGRAFTNRRNKMFDSWEKGFKEFQKSEYYKECAERARQTADCAKVKDKGFCQRRIDEAMASIRKLDRSIAEYKGYADDLANGRQPKDKYGWEVKVNAESISKNIDHWEEIKQTEIEKVCYYQECIEALGGVQFNKDNLNKGDIVKFSWHGEQKGKIIRLGNKNATIELLNDRLTYADGSHWVSKVSYSEITGVIEKAS